MNEMRILVTIPLPEGYFEAAAEITRHKGAVDTFREALGTGATVAIEMGAASIPKVRKARKPRSAPAAAEAA